MITKEDCKQLYNYYSQIETTESIISDLEKFVKELEGKVPDIIDENYSTFGSIEICIPYFENGRFKKGGARVFNIRYDAALLVLQDHVDNLRKKAEELSRRLEKGGAV